MKIDLALAAAELHYQKGYSQKEVAQELNLSPATVSRLLLFARRQGIVRISICPPPSTALARQLERQLSSHGISTVLVGGRTREAVGHSAARLLENSGSARATIVLDGGLTVGDFVNSLVPGAFEEVTLVPLCADPPSYSGSAYELMTRMATKYPLAHCAKLPHLEGHLLEELHRKVRATARAADFVFLGVGPWRPGFTALDFVRHLNLDPRRLQAKYRKVAAMCGYCAVTQEGKQVRLTELERRMPRSLTFEQLQELALEGRCKVVLLAANSHKLAALAATLNSRICNTLIIDEELAYSYLDHLTGNTGPSYGS